MAGVFLSRGMGIRVPVGGLVVSVGPDGKLDASLRLQVSLDMCPYWLEIAVGHLGAAARARADVIKARASGDEPSVGIALEREFSAGMQALTSSVIALDALYASVRERVSLPDSLVETWRSKRTARHRQAAEVFRRAFRVGRKGFANLAATLREVYRFRDLAVHPPGKFSDPVIHPTLLSGTEWRFVSFGYDSAHTAVRAALAMVVQLARSARAKKGPFVDYCAGLSAQLEPLVEIWKADFGALLDEPGGPGSSPANGPPRRTDV